MSQLQLKRISKEIIERAEDTLIPAQGLQTFDLNKALETFLRK